MAGAAKTSHCRNDDVRQPGLIESTSIRRSQPRRSRSSQFAKPSIERLIVGDTLAKVESRLHSLPRGGAHRFEQRSILVKSFDCAREPGHVADFRAEAGEFIDDFRHAA